MIEVRPSLALYRTPHKITPVPGPDGLQRCGHCSIRVYSVVVPGHWLHDRTAINRLREAEMLAVLHGTSAPVEVAEPCVWCHKLGPILDGTYVRMAMPGGEVVNCCDTCYQRGLEGEDDE